MNTLLKMHLPCSHGPKNLLYVTVHSEQNTVNTLQKKLLTITEVSDETADLLNRFEILLRKQDWKHKQ